MAKILIVDDEQLTVDMLSTYLGLIGHEAIGALSGRQTWDRLAYEEPDVVLLDIMLPDSNGIDICRQLRLDKATQNVPIIMISAASPPLQKEAAAAGANDYLVKPIKLDALKKALSQVGIFT
ncbi:MAG: response regulator [Anaerolineae bacterium]|nr:response regulator [Anaerolineae bacterium]